MAMSSFLASTLSSTILVVITFLHLLSTTSCLNHNQPPDTVQGLLVEEKTRLGSTPPSCYNKCNNCHPCMAVQVPTMPSHSQLKPRQITRATTTTDSHIDSSSPSSSSSSVGNRYSNYKPLGWKCRCGGHFYNP
nr:EPIDERMAL PATTERNING FACTOR-like protein 1 [Coffea arabica]